MKKTFSYYAVCWLIALAVFNVITFVTPNEFAGISKFTDTFRIGYIFITVAFIGQLGCAYKAFQTENLKKLFYNIPLISISYTGLVAMLVVGSICMAVPFIPYWIGIIACLLVLALSAVSVIKATFAADVVSGIDEKIKVQTFFIKSLTVEAEALTARAKNETVKAECKKVYEAVRYSDPMSNDALASVESEITLKFARFSEAVSSANSVSVGELANELVILIGDRNKKCMLLK